MTGQGDLKLDRSTFPTERYEPIQILGKGALGEVYLAKDKTLGRTVAVKCLLTVTDDQVVAFHREAKIASKLSHAHVISSLDFGTTGSGRPYLALEYFDGVSLEQFLSVRGQLDEELVSKIFCIVAAALGYIHSHKIFHRDLKPSNVLLKVDEEGHSIDVRIIDFGLSSIKEEFQTKTLMQGRTLVGTPMYMSPDQVSGGVYDARSEVYSLGCMLFESLTGRPPFSGEAALHILEQHVNSPPPKLHEARPDLHFSEGMQHVLDLCLAKSKSDRFQTMDALIEALQNRKSFSYGVDTQGEQKRLRTRWAVVAAVAVAVSLVLTVTVLQNLIAPAEEEPPGKSISKTNEVNPILMMSDPVSYMSVRTEGGDGFYVWGTENLERLERASKERTALDTVTIRGMPIDENVIDLLLPIKPRRLFLNHCDFRGDVVQHVAAIRWIEKLGFYSCVGVTPTSLSALKKLTHLNSLVLDDCAITDDHLAELAKLTHVKQFVLDGNREITLNGLKSLSRPDGKSVAVWIDSGVLSKLSLDEIAVLKSDCNIILVTKSMEAIRHKEQLVN
jgi:serine/threonine protein kinase